LAARERDGDDRADADGAHEEAGLAGARAGEPRHCYFGVFAPNAAWRKRLVRAPGKEP
jgi:hypothetical protein